MITPWMYLPSELVLRARFHAWRAVRDVVPRWALRDSQQVKHDFRKLAQRQLLAMSGQEIYPRYMVYQIWLYFLKQTLTSPMDHDDGRPHMPSETHWRLHSCGCWSSATNRLACASANTASYVPALMHKDAPKPQHAAWSVRKKPTRE